MITLVIGTDRKDSFTGKVCRAYSRCLNELAVDHQILDLSTALQDVFVPGAYGSSRPDTMHRLQETYFNPMTCFVFFIPEYNGSFPGILKWLVDSIDPRTALKQKRAALFGLSSGRAGSLRALDQWVGVLHYLQVSVMPHLTTVPHIDKEWVNDHAEPSEKLKTLISDHISRLVEFQAGIESLT